jgi:hypothetical protein
MANTDTKEIEDIEKVMVECRKCQQKADPKYRYITGLRMTSKTQMCGEVTLDKEENYRYEPVTLTVDEYIKIHHPDTKEYSVSETNNFYIVTLIERGNMVYTRLFAKFDDGKSAGGVRGKCDYLFDTTDAKRKKDRKKKEKENGSPIMAIRGDGSVTTLDRLLKGEPDLAPPDTLPRLNL